MEVIEGVVNEFFPLAALFFFGGLVGFVLVALQKSQRRQNVRRQRRALGLSAFERLLFLWLFFLFRLLLNFHRGHRGFCFFLLWDIDGLFLLWDGEDILFRFLFWLFFDYHWLDDRRFHILLNHFDGWN